MNYLSNTKKVFYPAVIIFVLVFLSACGVTPKSNFYQFNESVNPSLTGVEKGSIIGMGPIQIPEYINRPQIVTRSSAFQLNVAEQHRWVEPLKENITRTLVINISNNLQTNRVYWMPREDRQYPLDIRIAIDIGRFDGQLGKEVLLESRWSIFDKNNQPVLTRISLIKKAVNGQDYESLVIAMNKVLQQLGKEISLAARPFLPQ